MYEIGWIFGALLYVCCMDSIEHGNQTRGRRFTRMLLTFFPWLYLIASVTSYFVTLPSLPLIPHSSLE